MSLPVYNIIANSRKAMSPLATRDTPFIFNEWYVAAFGNEVTREMLSRKLLGKRVVMYRSEAGKAIALEDRCAHRSYPLSLGHLEGDALVCGYHGFRYDTQGNLVNVPSQRSCPRGIGVREYPFLSMAHCCGSGWVIQSLQTPAALLNCPGSRHPIGNAPQAISITRAITSACMKI